MKAAVILLALAGTAHAEPTGFSLDIGSHIRWSGDTSTAIVTDDGLAGMRLTLGKSLTRIREFGRDIDVGLFARWVYAVGTGKLFETLDTTVGQNLLGAGMRLSAPVLWSRLRGVAQAELGYARTSLQIFDGDAMPVDDHHWGPYGTATLGGEVALVTRPRFNLGLAVDLGYTVTMPVKEHALPGDRPDEMLSIPTDYASLGKLDTRGVTYSMSLRGAF